MMKATYRVELLVYDKQFPQSVFWPVKQAGVTIIDNVQRKIIKVPEASTAPALGDSMTVVTPIQAKQPADPMLYVSYVGLIISIVAAFTGLLFWWKRK